MEFSTGQISSKIGSDPNRCGFTPGERTFEEVPNAIDLRRVSDKSLISKTMSLVQAERELLISLLHHLREIDRRRLYSALEYKSLHDFTVRHLGYPDDQAYRRINAMKLLRELPELEEKISGGAISLTHIGQAQVLFNSEKKHSENPLTRDEKLDVFNQISNKSVRESERITLSLSSNPKEMKPDRIKAVTCDKSEFKFMASTTTREKIEKLKGLLAHKNPNITLGELFEKLCDLGLEQWEPSRRTAAPRKSTVKRTSGIESERKADSDCAAVKDSADERASRSDEKVAAPRKSMAARGTSIEAKPKAEMKITAQKISAARVRREVFARAKNACENCGSTFALEVDHIWPRAVGGADALENLRLLCRSCNQRAAVQVFGVDKMGRYLET